MDGWPADTNVKARPMHVHSMHHAWVIINTMSIIVGTSACDPAASRLA